MARDGVKVERAHSTDFTERAHPESVWNIPHLEPLCSLTLQPNSFRNGAAPFHSMPSHQPNTPLVQTCKGAKEPEVEDTFNLLHPQDLL